MKANQAIMPIASVATIQRPCEIDVIGVLPVSAVLTSAAKELFEFDKIFSLQWKWRVSKQRSADFGKVRLFDPSVAEWVALLNYLPSWAIK